MKKEYLHQDHRRRNTRLRLRVGLSLFPNVLFVSRLRQQQKRGELEFLINEYQGVFPP